MKVRVETGSRLHLGFLDLGGGEGRRYGSLGISLNRPGVLLEAEEAAAWFYQGPEAFRERVEEAAGAVSLLAGRTEGVPPIRLCLRKVIPPHVGLGSGTQVSLAAGTAVAELLGVRTDPRQLATLLRRGRRSGIGVEAFAGGGFLLDGGIRGDGGTPPLLLRRSLPASWRFLVVLPETAPGISGAAEEQALATLPPAGPSVTGELCRLVLLGLLPSLVEEDGIAFGRALTEIQRLVGSCFLAAQGGVYASPLSEHLVTLLLEMGALGAGQSSWGPAVFGFFDDPLTAEQVRKRLLGSREFAGGTIFAAGGAREGARIHCRKDAEGEKVSCGLPE